MADPKVAEAKAAEDKAAAEKASFEASLKALEIKLPEGFQEMPELSKFKEIAAKHGLKSEGAQAVVDLFIESQKAQQTAQQKAIEQLSTEYENRLKSDKEFGGAKFDETVQLARKAIKAYADPAELSELKDFFAKSVVGNYTPLVKMLAKVGRASSEGHLEGTTSEGGATPKNNSDAFHRQIYPKTFAEHWDRKS